MFIRKWATRNLRAGDLTALSAILNGSSIPEKDRVERLARRRFIAKKNDGRLAITLAGRVALVVRRVTMI